MIISKKQKELEWLNSASYALIIGHSIQWPRINNRIGQAKYSAAIQLGNRPTMIFNGDLDKYVQFVTMFRTMFDNVVKDSGALYNLLSRHVIGPIPDLLISDLFTFFQNSKYFLSYQQKCNVKNDCFGKFLGQKLPKIDLKVV